MNELAMQIRERFVRLKREFSEAEEAQSELERVCRHQYGPTIYDPLITEAYTIPGDPPGTMGVDWRGPCEVPRSVEKRWKRECTLCGKIEYTTNIKQEIKENPMWPGESA